MRSFCCILFIISFVTIALADDPDGKVSETFYLCDIEVLTNLTSEFGATNEILRSERGSLQPKMKRMENDLNDIKTEIHGISEIKANGKRLLEALDKNYMPSSCSEVLEAGKIGMERVEKDLNDIKADTRGISEIKANGQLLLEALNKSNMQSSCSEVLEAGKIKLERVENDLKDIKASISDLSEIKANVKRLLEAIEAQKTIIERVEKDLNNMKAGNHGVSEIKAHDQHIIEALYEINLPSSCSEALKEGKPSGVYRIYIPRADLEPFDVYCMEDPDGGPAWTIIQRREDGSVDFNRDWESYKNGFGNLSGEYWIGLDRIHAMTSYHQPNSLWVQLGDFKIETRFAEYDKFAISGERENYTLSALGLYRGDAGDSLRPHLYMKFSTKDRDNDEFPNESCAITCQGAWWYRSCYLSNLNGPYGRNETKGQTIAWNTWAYYYPLKYSHMAIRPNN